LIYTFIYDSSAGTLPFDSSHNYSKAVGFARIVVCRIFCFLETPGWAERADCSENIRSCGPIILSQTMTNCTAGST